MGTVFSKGFPALELVCNKWLVRHAHDSTSHKPALSIRLGAGRRDGVPPFQSRADQPQLLPPRLIVGINLPSTAQNAGGCFRCCLRPRWTNSCATT